MRKAIFLIGTLWLVLAGCSGKQTALTPLTPANNPIAQSQEQGHTAKPLVFQSGKIPVQWTQFKWGDTVENPYVYNAITTVGGVMWYTDYFSNKLIKMTMAGVATAFHLTCACPTAGTLFYPGSITVGANGDLYVGTGSPSGYIGIATQTGSFSVKKIPSGDSTYYAGAGALGPDGNVWFTEEAHYAKITPGGTITEFAYPDGNTSNYYGSVASGPNGDVWMAEYNEDQIDDVDPTTGALTSYTLPCQPIGLITGSDGNLWTMCSDYLVRVTPSGSYTEVAYVPGLTNDGYPSALAKGPNGDPWWTISGENELATYNIATNEMDLYIPPTGFSADYGLTAGPDGNVWALDNGGFTDVYILNVLNFTPKPLTFTSIGQVITITVTEPGTTSWTATSSDTAEVTVTPTTPPSKFNVKAVAPGTTKVTITVQDAIGNSSNTTATVPTPTPTPTAAVRPNFKLPITKPAFQARVPTL
jgi:streptogramin lyase